MEACGNYERWRENGMKTIPSAADFGISTDSTSYLDALD